MKNRYPTFSNKETGTFADSLLKPFIGFIILFMLSQYVWAQGPNDKTNTLEIVALNDVETLLDKTTVSYDPDATSAFDVTMDVNKTPGNPNHHLIYSLCDTQWMSVNNLKSIVESPDVPVHFYAGVDGQYIFSFNGVASFDPTVFVTLEDKKQHLFHNIRSGNYLFQSSTTDDRNRFVLHFTPALVMTITPGNCLIPGNLTLDQQGSTVWSYTVLDFQDSEVLVGVLSSGTPVNAGLIAGTYQLNLRDDFNYTVVKTFTIEGIDTLSAVINLSSEILHTGETLELSGQSAGADTHTWNFGDGNTATGTEVEHVYQTEGIYTLTYTASNTAGCQKSVQKTITVNDDVAIGIKEGKKSMNSVKVWSFGSEVVIDFSPSPSTHADISMTNILGQEIMKVHHEQSNVLRIPVKNMNQGYILVSVLNNGEGTVAKVILK